jgi:hypothetical protein
VKFRITYKGDPETTWQKGWIERKKGNVHIWTTGCPSPSKNPKSARA